MIPYLLAADIQNTVFSAAFTFWTTPIYDLYDGGPELFGFTPLADQSAAGALMWVIGSAVFLIPVGWILVKQLTPQLHKRPAHQALAVAVSPSGTLHLPIHGGGSGSIGAATPRHGARIRPGDLLRTPVLGAMFRSRIARRCVQSVLLIVAVLMVIDGLLGPRTSPMNLAGVLPWDALARLRRAGPAACRKLVFAGPVRSCCRGNWANVFDSTHCHGHAPCATSGLPLFCCWYFSGATKCCRCGTALGGRRGSLWGTSWRPSPSTASSKARRFASGCALLASFTLWSQWCHHAK